MVSYDIDEKLENGLLEERIHQVVGTWYSMVCESLTGYLSRLFKLYVLGHIYNIPNFDISSR